MSFVLPPPPVHGKGTINLPSASISRNSCKWMEGSKGSLLFLTPFFKHNRLLWKIWSINFIQVLLIFFFCHEFSLQSWFWAFCSLLFQFCLVLALVALLLLLLLLLLFLFLFLVSDYSVHDWHLYADILHRNPFVLPPSPQNISTLHTPPLRAP